MKKEQFTSAQLNAIISILFRLNRIFSSTIDCRPSYQTEQDIKCVFQLRNKGQRTYSVLTWTTPLRGLQSSCLTLSRDGKEFEYQ